MWVECPGCQGIVLEAKAKVETKAKLKVEAKVKDNDLAAKVKATR